MGKGRVYPMPRCSLPPTHMQMCNQGPAIGSLHSGSSALHKDKENRQDVKRWAAHQNRLFYGLLAGHNEHMTQLSLKKKLRARSGAQKRRWSAWHDMRHDMRQ